MTFEALFEELAPYLLRVIPRMGVDAPDVQDVAQEVFVIVHRKLAGFQGRSSLRTWVYGICLRVCADYRRKNVRRAERPLLVTHEAVAPSPERISQSQRALQALDAVLATLQDGQRDCWVMVEVEGLSMREASQAMHCPVFTAYSRYYAARAAVRKALAEHQHEEP